MVADRQTKDVLDIYLWTMYYKEGRLHEAEMA